MDNKPKKRKIMMTEETRQYLRGERNKNNMQKRLDMLGYRSKEEYMDCVSYLAW